MIIGSGCDPLALARIGTQFSEGDPNGTEGYDGQFVYYIARDIKPDVVSPFLDVPAYRYQRILLPFLGWLLSLGQSNLLPWILPIIIILSHLVGTWSVSKILIGWEVNRWYALVYGLWVGFLLAIRLDLPEPLAYALVAGAILSFERDKMILSWILFGLALFAKEVALLFVVAALFAALMNRQRSNVYGLVLVTILPYVIYQLWLMNVFGAPGLGSGGAMATPFEWIPLMGLLRIGYFSPVYLVAMLVVFVPAVIIPAIWGIYAGLKKIRSKDVNMVVLALIFNAFVILFIPFSTFRETGGLLRFSCGLVLAVLLFATRYNLRRVMNYSYLWLVLNVFIIKS